jgi:hypothetical protein
VVSGVRHRDRQSGRKKAQRLGRIAIPNGSCKLCSSFAYHQGKMVHDDYQDDRWYGEEVPQ